jgi:hypothetical protein
MLVITSNRIQRSSAGEIALAMGGLVVSMMRHGRVPS